MLFQDRYVGGKILAEHLLRYQKEAPIIIALPRGGVPVGYEVALALDAPLDVVVSRKLGAPMNPEFGFGAIAPGARAIDDLTVRMLGLSAADIEPIIQRETIELNRREALFHGTVEPLPVEGRTVIVVDDGLATGVTARAAIASLRRRSPQRIIFAAPVCAPDSADALRAHADEVVCISMPEDFTAVGIWYRNFGQTTDSEALDLLNKGRLRKLTPPPPGHDARPASPHDHR